MQPTRAAPAQTIRLRSDLPLGIEGNRVRGRHVLEQGERAYCCLSWAEGLAAPDGRRRGGREDRRDDALLARLARPRADPGPPLARPDPALGARDQGPDLHADRRDRGGAHDVAARDAGRRAQLGLPLHVDARHDVHAPGAALAQPRLGGRRVHAVRRRPRGERGRRAADHVRDRRAPRPDRVDAATTSRATRARGPCGSATARSTSARTTSSARCSTRSCSTPARASGCRGSLWPIVESQAECATKVWREPDQGIWEARGAPQQYVSSKLMCWVALDRAAQLAEIRGDPRLQADVGGDRGGDPGRHPRARRQRARRPPPALRDRRARRVGAARRDLRLPARRRRAPAGDRRTRSPTT